MQKAKNDMERIDEINEKIRLLNDEVVSLYKLKHDIKFKSYQYLKGSIIKVDSDTVYKLTNITNIDEYHLYCEGVSFMAISNTHFQIGDDDYIILDFDALEENKYMFINENELEDFVTERFESVKKHYLG